MPWLRILAVALLVLSGCGDDGDDAPPTIDGALGPGVDAGASVLDAAPGAFDAQVGPALDAGRGLGEFCSSTAPDGSPLACAPGAVCCTAGTTICTLPDECPTGGAGYVPCATSSECQGRICCAVPAWSAVFCTKESSCTSYGGTVVP